MRVLLLEHPRSFSPERCNDIANTPLCSSLLTGYSAGVLRSRGYEVDIVEGYLERLLYREVEERIKKFEPDILGVHVVYQWETNLELNRLLERVKRHLPSTHITAYGFYPTFAYAELLHSCPAIESVIVGEPEITLAELAGSISRKAGLEGIAGLVVRQGSGQITYYPRELVEDLDSLPFPVRTEAMFGLREVNLLGSRGCYGKCGFCHINPFYGHGSRWRARSPQNIAAEIEEIMAKHGRREFYFTDPNFLGPGSRGRRRALELASLIKSLGVYFGMEARVNDIEEQTIEALVEAGLRHILIGLESGTDRSLSRLNKMTSVAQNERAIDILRRCGLEPNIGFIMFEPDSSLEDVRANLEFLQRNQLLDNLPITANVLYHHQIILKGTPAYHELLRRGRLRLSPANPYEGTAVFTDERVEVLADIMRQVTNFLFFSMDGIWSGREAEPPGATEKYQKINKLLVELFAANLELLEAGVNFTAEKKGWIIHTARDKIDGILKAPPAG